MFCFIVDTNVINYLLLTKSFLISFILYSISFVELIIASFSTSSYIEFSTIALMSLNNSPLRYNIKLSSKNLFTLIIIKYIITMFGTHTPMIIYTTIYNSLYNTYNYSLINLSPISSIYDTV